MTPRTTASVPVASRISGFVYAIRNIVAEARKVEAAGRKVRYLNIGDPITFGFKTPPHLVEAVERAMRDGHNGYAPSVGIAPAREAVAAECQRRGMPLDARSRRHHVGHVRRHRAGADRARRTGRRGARAGADLSALHRGAREDRRAAGLLPARRPTTAGCRTSSTFDSLIGPATRALVVIDPNNPTGATYPDAVRRALLEIADEHNIPLLADEVYADLAFDGPVDAIAQLNPDAPVITFSSLSKAYLAPGWRAGWMAVGRTRAAGRRARRRSRSWRTAGCAAPDRWNTRSSRR